jgi:hypothetical protein
MESNPNYENKPTVGINFFKSISPVGKENSSNQRTEFIEVPQVITGVTNRDTHQKLRTVDKIQDTTVVKGFGGTTLFTFGLLATSKRAGDRLRLDNDVDKQGRLFNAENICRRNLRLVRKYYKEEDKLEIKDSSCDTNDA